MNLSPHLPPFHPYLGRDPSQVTGLRSRVGVVLDQPRGGVPELVSDLPLTDAGLDALSRGVQPCQGSGEVLVNRYFCLA